MQARLSNHYIEVPLDELDDQGTPKKKRIYPLQELKTRLPEDPSIALLDAWATVADVLTFYQERIANEGYLRTALERRSVLELARLIGYSLRPGVAASVWLALELEKGYEVKIRPFELKSQSVPSPGEMPQTFENVEECEMRHAWNKLQPRLKQPQTIETITQDNDKIPLQPRIYVKGINANLKQNDVIMITMSGEPKEIYRVVDVKPDPPMDLTLVTLKTVSAKAATGIVREDLKAIADVADQYASAKVMESYGASAQREMAQRVIPRLKLLSETLRRTDITVEAADRVIRETLVAIREEKKTATDEQYKRMADWLTATVDKLTQTAKGVMTASARGRAVAWERSAAPGAVAGGSGIDPLKNAILGLMKEASVPPRNAARLDRDASRIFDARADVGLQIAGTFQAKLQQSLPTALANVKVAQDSQVSAYVFRVVARPFGHNAPLKSRIVETLEREIATKTTTVSYDEWTSADMLDNEVLDGKTLYLDANYDKVQQDSWVVVDTSGVAQRGGTSIVPTGEALLIGKVSNLKAGISRAAYGMSGQSTSTQLSDPVTNKLKAWFEFKKKKKESKAVATNKDESFNLIRQTAVYIQSEELDLADEPIASSICGDDDLIELDGLYSGLQSGRWLIVAGERDDIQDESGNRVRGVKATELVMLAEVIQKVKKVGERDVLPGDQIHTFIKLAKKLEYCYRRDTVTIYGNVVKATHGETRKEVMGSGDGGKALQSFVLKQPPLTFVSASNPSGADSTLKVFVNDVQWREADSLAGLSTTDRKFNTKTDDEGKTTVIFGNGREGARLPSGNENIKAEYRNGIGKPGNVNAGQISLLMSRPLGVKEVINPLRSSGGADKEGRDQARKSAPLAVKALDRLVSVQDYEDFARTYAGIGKAYARELSDGRQQVVHVTIAGADDIPIDENSDLFQNLRRALHDFGDPFQPVQLAVRELMLIVISARVSIMPDYRWEPVVMQLRLALLDAFSFERRELGQDVLLSEVISVMQGVRGVAYVDVDVLGGAPEKKIEAGKRRLLTPEEIAKTVQDFIKKSQKKGRPELRLPVNLSDYEGGIIRPAQLAFLTPDVPDTLIMNQTM